MLEALSDRSMLYYITLINHVYESTTKSVKLRDDTGTFDIKTATDSSLKIFTTQTGMVTAFLSMKKYQTICGSNEVVLFSVSHGNE